MCQPQPEAQIKFGTYDSLSSNSSFSRVCTVEAKKRVSDDMDELVISISATEKILEALGARLFPLLRRVNEVNEEKNKESESDLPSVLLSERLESQIKRINKLNLLLSAIIDRLEI